MATPFEDRHLCQFGFRMIEQPARLIVTPRSAPLGIIAAILVFVHAVILGILFSPWFSEAEPRYTLLILAVMAFEFPMLLGVFFLLSKREVAKGPLLDVDKTQRVVGLPRDAMTVRFDDIQAITLTTGWYESTTDWQKAAELSLVLAQGDAPASHWPVVLHHDIKEVDALALRVAEWIEKPVERVTLEWKDRQKRSATARPTT